MKYKFILVDKLKKTLKSVDSLSCEASTIKFLCSEFKIEWYEFHARYRLFFNGQNITFDKLPKKYLKYQKVN